MVEEAKLFDHLQLLRDYYALGRGELFQQFIVSAEEHLKNIPNRYVILKLNTIFHENAKKIYSENDKTYRRFELLFPKDENEKSNFSIKKSFFFGQFFNIIFFIFQRVIGLKLK